MDELSLFSEQEKTMTTRELAETLGVSIDTVTRAASKVLDPSAILRRVVNGGESRVFTERQATIIKQEIQKHHNLATRQIDNVSTELEENQTIQLANADADGYDWITVQTAAKILGVSVGTVYSKINSGALDAKRIASSLRVRKSEVVEIDDSKRS